MDIYKFPMTRSEEIDTHKYFSWVPHFWNFRDYREFTWWRLRIKTDYPDESLWVVQWADRLVRPPIYTTLLKFGKKGNGAA